jgi:O-antigen/teichoic acid export membrane protein
MDNQQYSLLKRDVVRILGVVSILVFLVSLFSQEIIWVLVDEKYKESASVLPLLTLSVFFMVLWQMWGRGISYKRKTIWTSGIGIVSALLNISLNYYLIPIYSMKGAVYATLISFIFMSFSGYFVSKYLLKIYTVNIYSLKYIFAFNIFTLCITFIESAVILYTLKGIVIIAISIGVFHFRKSIVKIVKDRSG